MQKVRFDLWNPSEYEHPETGSFVPNLRGYLHDDGADRPALLVCPGGAYFMTSPAEAQNVAERFFRAGFQSFFLVYTTSPALMVGADAPPLGMQPLRDLSRAVQALRHHRAAWRILPDRVVVCGFSAGGHLAGSIATRHQDLDPADAAFPDESNRPDAVVLSYPVITTDPAFRDEGTFRALLGPDPDPEALAAFSLEKRVSPLTPPVFLWHTMTDDGVPVENSLLFAAACRRAGVPCELHVFREGRHGLSLADRDWADGKIGEDGPDCLEPFYEYVRGRAASDPGSLPAPLREAARCVDLPAFLGTWYRLMEAEHPSTSQEPVPAVAVWPDLVANWLEALGFPVVRT